MIKVSVVSVDMKTIVFVISITKKTSHHIEFSAEKVVSWTIKDEPIDTEKYLSGSVKFDGCSNIEFEDDIMHFCGEKDVIDHCMLMKGIYKMAESEISGWEG